MQPLLCLAMIVKNEAESIVETIASARTVVDRIVILDTGSTDGTQELARSAFQGVPGEVVEGEFIDFSTTRNQAIELAEKTGAVFVLMLSGNESLRGDVQALQRFCEAERETKTGGYFVSCAMGGMVYPSIRLSRTGAGWRYTGVTHEVMLGPSGEVPTTAVPGVFIKHDVSTRTREKCIPGWQRDVALLTAALEKNPTDTRSTFYLAQSYEMLREHGKAIDLYRKRVDLGGWKEEVFISLLRIARNMHDLGMSWPAVQIAYMAAYAYNPRRAEPLYALGKYYYDINQHHLAYMFFLAAAELPVPSPSENPLFVEPVAYEASLRLLSISAWHSGHFEVGEVATRKALQAAPEDEGLKKNLAQYVQQRQNQRLTNDLDVADLRKRLGKTQVIVSFTTIPSRYDLLKKAVTSLINQRFKADAIFLVLPEMSAREGVPYPYPAWLDGLPKEANVQIVRVPRDYGPACKLFGPLQMGLDPDTIIATFDDDSEYEEHILEKLVDRSLRYPDAAVGFSGINVERLIREGEYELVYEQFGRRPQDPTPANIVEGYCGAAYRRRFFDTDIYDTSGFPPDVFYVDDFWFGGYLARKGIQKLIFHYSDCTLTREDVWLKLWKQNGLGTDSNPLHLLPDFKEKNRRVARAFKEKDPEIWERDLRPVPQKK